MTHPIDENTALKLNYLREHDLPAHLNMKRVLDAVYIANLATHAEKAFVAGATAGYDCYGVLLDYEEDFARYLGMQHYGNALYYLSRRVGHPFAAIYAVGPDERILTRKHLQSESEIRDILWTFGPCLGRCGPYDLVCEIDPGTSAVKTMKGRVCHAVQL